MLFGRSSNRLQRVVMETTVDVKHVQNQIIEKNGNVDMLPKTFYRYHYSTISSKRDEITRLLNDDSSLKMSYVQGIEGPVPAIAYLMWLEKWLEILHKHC